MSKSEKYYFGTKESICAMCIEICLEQDGLEPDCSHCRRKFFTKDEIICKILDPMHDYNYRTWYTKGEKAFNNLLGVKDEDTVDIYA